jgi:hypothetical protein
MTGPGLEQAMARVSAEVTEEAAYKHRSAVGKADHPHAVPAQKSPEQG